ncbi:hypothetical protein NI17_003045 [Thermobifida halotolerans]|uniref:Uncharacterized protein n=1 Tax=Thermobifida halotolerans TaxID=483545 RepID=A0AA97M4R4_9ACTN|nr:hypothetical protein [Thermobifida halotolerans]UOE20237.1 hypothetical protein NI17_003045 [Thermobifida halotolerans]
MTGYGPGGGDAGPVLPAGGGRDAARSRAAVRAELLAERLIDGLRTGALRPPGTE